MTLAPSFHSNLPEVFARFGEQIRSTAPEIKYGLRTTVRGTALRFAAEAASAAAFSHRIPGTFRITEGAGSVLVAAGDDTGEAAAVEHRGVGGRFRHPVFGNRDVWVSQPAHPFFGPPFVRATTTMETQMGTLAESVFLRIGYL